ncbi:hypothetical protein GOODEAATRI_017070 [Goodea atripinnis]|uniref:Uncharacterized protein n=1 Tax=Goodea atripinnis TaxID=208336 RepID=A0ABV0PYQ1_9TELE
MEVRQLPSTQALEAKLSRMSYPAAKDQEALLRLFTLILAAIFPSNSSDRFTLSKLLAVALSMGGVALVSMSSMESPDEKGVAGNQGISVLLPLSPLNLVLPSQLVWTYILINGLIGTVLSEFLWLWGCFLTSSLIGTLALSLTIPLSILADICLQKVNLSPLQEQIISLIMPSCGHQVIDVSLQVRFSWLFFAGAVPVFLSFFIATLLCHYNNWDPVLVGLRRLYTFIFRKHRIQRYNLTETTAGFNVSVCHSFHWKCC